MLQRSRRVRGVQAQVQYSAVQVQYSTVQYRLASCPYCRLRFSEATVTRNILAETTSYDRFLYSAANGCWYVR